MRGRIPIDEVFRFLHIDARELLEELRREGLFDRDELSRLLEAQ